MRYRLEVRLTAADVGKRVVIRWRRPGPDDGEQIADVLGILEEADAGSFAVRTRDGRLVVIPTGRALAGKWCHTARPPAPRRPQASLTGGSADAAWPPSRCPPKPAHPHVTPPISPAPHPCAERHNPRVGRTSPLRRPSEPGLRSRPDTVNIVDQPQRADAPHVRLSVAIGLGLISIAGSILLLTADGIGGSVRWTHHAGASAAPLLLVAGAIARKRRASA